jgi:hypothetical protein
MKYLIVLFAAFLSLNTVQAQVIEVNPNIDWKYIRSQDLDLKKSSVYQYEFPAEIGYDYVFNMYFKEVDLITTMKVYDLQMKPISSKTDSSSSQNTSLSFRVPASGTYYIVLSYNGKREDEHAELTTKFTLIRRPRIN